MVHARGAPKHYGAHCSQRSRAVKLCRDSTNLLTQSSIMCSTWLIAYRPFCYIVYITLCSIGKATALFETEINTENSEKNEIVITNHLLGTMVIASYQRVKNSRRNDRNFQLWHQE